MRPFVTGPFFSEFALALPCSAEDFAREMRARGVDPGVPLTRMERGGRPVFEDTAGQPRTPDDSVILVAVTEVNTPKALEAYVVTAREVLEGLRARVAEASI